MPPNIQLSFHGDWTRRWPECLPLSISKISIPFQLEDSDPGWWDPTHPLFISPLPLPRSSFPGAPWSPMQIGKYKPAFLGSHLNSKVKTASSQALLLGSIFQEKQCNAGASSASGLRKTRILILYYPHNQITNVIFQGCYEDKNEIMYVKYSVKLSVNLSLSCWSL